MLALFPGSLLFYHSKLWVGCFFLSTTTAVDSSKNKKVILHLSVQKWNLATNPECTPSDIQTGNETAWAVFPGVEAVHNQTHGCHIFISHVNFHQSIILTKIRSELHGPTFFLSHTMVAMVAGKLRRQWLWVVYFGIMDFLPPAGSDYLIDNSYNCSSK